jgi:transposase
MEKEVCDKCRPLFIEMANKFEAKLVDQQAQIDELKRRLLSYENAHTPPSKKRRYPKREPTGNPIGAPKGHTGNTRLTPKPDKIVDVKQDYCNKCNHELHEPIKITQRIIEDIPEPQPITVTQFNVHNYLCRNCAEVNIPSHKDLPTRGRFGYNLQTQIALMKYEDRLPYEKIANNLNRTYGLHLTPATILNILWRVTGSCEPVYDNIRQQVKKSSNTYADETGQKVQGKQWWTWLFTTLTAACFLIRRSRGQKVIDEMFDKEYKGILNCDGWSSYPKKVKRIQRCWAHLLREAKFLSQQHKGQAKLTYTELCEIFKKIKSLQEKNLSFSERKKEKEKLELQMNRLVKRIYHHKELRKFSKLIQNGILFWFTCVLHPQVEPTNNRAEQGLREAVIQRKITGTLRNEKGTHMMEVLLSCIQTWKLQGLNTYSMLRQTLSS